LEREAVVLLTEAITHCASVGDYTTRAKLESIVKSEEEHIDWIETQMETIKQVGVENYLAQHIHEE
jgi:bacterioferritin